MPTLSKADLESLPQGRLPLGIKVIGTFKLISAVLLVGLGYGIFKQIGTDPAIETGRIVGALKLDPDNKYIHQAMAAISGVSPKQLYALSAGTFLYAILYSIEGIGLLLHKRWGEYFTVFMTGSLIPFEAYEVLRKPTVLRTLILLLNVGIVAYLVLQLRRSRRVERVLAGTPEATATPIAD